MGSSCLLRLLELCLNGWSRKWLTTEYALQLPKPRAVLTVLAGMDSSWGSGHHKTTQCQVLQAKRRQVVNTRSSKNSFPGPETAIEVYQHRGRGFLQTQELPAADIREYAQRIGDNTSKDRISTAPETSIYLTYNRGVLSARPNRSQTTSSKWKVVSSLST